MGDLLDFSAKKEQLLEVRKREFERVIFDDIVDSYLEIDNNILAINIINISHHGCLLAVPKNCKKAFKKDDLLHLRIYFSPRSYIPLSVNIVREEEERTFGCTFNESSSSPLLNSFIQFIYSYAQHAQIDQNERKIFFT